MKNILRLLLLVKIILTVNAYGYSSIETVQDESEYPTITEYKYI